MKDAEEYLKKYLVHEKAPQSYNILNGRVRYVDREYVIPCTEWCKDLMDKLIAISVDMEFRFKVRMERVGAEFEKRQFMFVDVQYPVSDKESREFVARIEADRVEQTHILYLERVAELNKKYPEYPPLKVNQEAQDMRLIKQLESKINAIIANYSIKDDK